VVKDDSEICLWEHIEPQEVDWCDQYVNDVNQDSGKTSKLSMQDIVSWYNTKMRDIERYSGIITHAYQLGLLALQNNISVSCF